LLSLFISCHGHIAPPFTGGVLDSWPFEAVEAWPIFEEELYHVRQHIESKG
jgi:hypothetical protein